jgi:hypothetical protein
MANLKPKINVKSYGSIFGDDAANVPNADDVANIAVEKPDNRRAAAYLHYIRGIDYEIINYHIKRGVLYEDASKYHNIVFAGKDKAGNIRYASLHHSASAPERRYIGEAPGSDKRYSFSERGANPEHLMVFEGSIDAMSAQTLMKY